MSDLTMEQRSAMHSALEASQTVLSAWQPISTFDVSQERARVLGYGNFRDGTAVNGIIPRQIVLLDWVQWIGKFSSSALPFQPTHWMPLPSVPDAA